MSRRHVMWCTGTSPLTGKRVGQRHRWSGYANGKGWGTGRCEFCHRTLEEVLEPKTVNKAIQQREGKTQ